MLEISRLYYTILVMLSTLGSFLTAWIVLSELGYMAPVMFGMTGV